MLQKSLGILEVFEAFWHVTFWQLNPRGLVLFMFLVLFGCVDSVYSRRSLQDPAGLKTRMKMERLRNIKEQAEMDGGVLSMGDRSVLSGPGKGWF